MSRADVDLSKFYSRERFLKQVDSTRERKLIKLWNGRNYTKFLNILEKRLELLRILHRIYNIELQSEALEGWRTKLYNFDEFEFYAELRAPAVHYRILPNEIVFDIDCDDRLDKARKEAKRVVKELLLVGAKPFVGFSGNRGYHIHLIIAPPDGDVFNFAISYGCREFTLTLFDILKDLIKPEYLDDGVMTAEHHTIRSFYSLNMKTMKWKRPVFGDNYQIWVLSKSFWYRVFKELREKMELEDITNLEQFDEFRPININNINKRYKWIKQVLEHPEKIVDGRGRLLWLAIVPYLLLQGYNENQIEELCRKWIEKTGVEWNSRYRCKVRSTIRHCVDYLKKTGKKWFPISFDKLLESFRDLDYLKEVVS